VVLGATPVLSLPAIGYPGLSHRLLGPVLDHDGIALRAGQGGRSEDENGRPGDEGDFHGLAKHNREGGRMFSDFRGPECAAPPGPRASVNPPWMASALTSGSGRPGFTRAAPRLRRLAAAARWT